MSILKLLQINTKPDISVTYKGKEYYCLGHSGICCGGESIEYECGYDTNITCDECVFVVGRESGDKRRGKRPFKREK